MREFEVMLYYAGSKNERFLEDAWDEWGISVTEKKSYQCPNFKPVENQEERDKAVVASYEGLIDAQMKQFGL